jgi:hypothetical protein
MSHYKDKLLGLTKLRYEILPILIGNIQKYEKRNCDDPISRISKCHLLSEVILDKLIKFAFEPNGDAILSARLSYSQKLDISSKTILTEDYSLISDMVVGSLRKLNKIRNRLSHELGAIITQEEAMELFMGEDYPLPFDPQNTDVSLILSHYMSFIFGNMLPKYESI